MKKTLLDYQEQDGPNICITPSDRYDYFMITIDSRKFKMYSDNCYVCCVDDLRGKVKKKYYQILEMIIQKLKSNCVILNYADNQLYKIYYISNCKLHRTDGPAYIEYSTDRVYENYYINSLRHRNGDKPAYIVKNHDNVVLREEYYKHGHCHRSKKPALIAWNENGEILVEKFYFHGEPD